MKNSNHKRPVLFLIFFFALTLAPLPTLAESFYWNGNQIPGQTNWHYLGLLSDGSSTTNWGTGTPWPYTVLDHLPTPSDEVYILRTAAGQPAPHVIASQDVLVKTSGSDIGRIWIEETNDWASSANIGTRVEMSNLLLGYGSGGKLVVKNTNTTNTDAWARLETADSTIGWGWLGNGEASLIGTRTIWQDSGTMKIGDNGGSGLIEVENRAWLDTDIVSLGSSILSDGTMDISGAGSTWIIRNSATIGEIGSADGTVTLSNSALAVLDSGSLTSAATLIVGDAGTGSLEINGYSQLTDGFAPSTDGTSSGGGDDAPSAHIILGNGATGVGTIEIWGRGTSTHSRLENSNSIDIGLNGTGSINVNNGGELVAKDVTLGTNKGSSGTGTVTHDLSRWQVNGAFKVGNGGEGIFNITSGAEAESSNAIIGADSGGNGVATVSGTGLDPADAPSTWTDNDILIVGQAGSGQLNIVDKALVDTKGGVIGASSGGSGTVNVDGADALWQTSLNDLTVGAAGTGAMTIENGGRVSNGLAVIGRTAVTGSGSVTVTGAGSTWDTNDYSLTVGAGGTGAMSIEDGGVVGSGDAVIGRDSTSASNTVTVTGTGSTWGLSGHTLTIGKAGSGTMNVEAGGLVISDNAIIAEDSSTSTATVTGNDSRWNLNNSNLTVGNLGYGTLDIEDQGLVDNVTTMSVGAGSGSEGAVNLTGTGATLQADTLSVGGSGEGFISARDGSSLQTTNVTIGSGAGSNGEVNLNDSDTGWTNTATINIGLGATGSVGVGSGATLSSNSVIAGVNSGSRGTLTVNGLAEITTLTLGESGEGIATVGGTLNATNTVVGESAIGTLTINGTADLGDLVAGKNATGEGTATINGSSSAASVVIGQGGIGTLNVNNRLNTSGNVSSGHVDGGSGAINAGGSAAELIAADININKGSLTVDQGALVQSDNTHLGILAGVTGSAVIGDTGSRLATGSLLTVGAIGTGALTVENGGQLSSAATYIGGTASGSTGIGEATVRGAGTLWQNSDTLDIGLYGNGAVLSISDSADVQVGAQTRIGAAGGILNLSGGSLTTRFFTMDSGSAFNHSAGTLTVDGGAYNEVAGTDVTVNGTNPIVRLHNGATLDTQSWDVEVGTSSGNQGTLEIAGGSTVQSNDGSVGNNGGTGTVTIDGTGSRWDIADDLGIGKTSGQGTITLTDGAALNSLYGSIGSDLTSSGEVNINNSTWTNDSTLTVGRYGTGAMTVNNGGTVSSNVGHIGLFSDGTGSVTVTGTNSNWSTGQADLRVGYAGTGDLDILDNGEVTNTNGIIGALSGSIGNVSVAGGGSWNNSGDLTVGAAGSGVMGVNNGTVSSVNAHIGVNGIGAVTVSGSSASWINNSAMDIGSSGQGTLNIMDSGTVSTGSATIGSGTDSDAIVSVDSGGNWHMAGTLDIGTGGILSLVGGLVDGVTTTTVSANGAVNMNGGVLDTANLAITGGTVSVNTGGIADTTAVTMNNGRFEINSYEKVLSVDASDGTIAMNNGSFNTAIGITLSNSARLEGYGLVNGWVENNGTVIGGTGTQTLTFLGYVHGESDFENNIRLAGGYAPGSSKNAAAIEFDNLELYYFNTLYFDLGGLTRGSAYDAMNIAGDFLISGSLRVNTFNEFNPLLGNSFDLFDFGSTSLSGTFADISLPGLDTGLAWDTGELYTSGLISVVAGNGTQTSVPATLLLFGIGLVGLVGLRIKQRDSWTT